jgi:hypothetical protein
MPTGAADEGVEAQDRQRLHNRVAGDDPEEGFDGLLS